MTSLVHLTVNTGHSVESPRSAVDNRVIAALRPLIATGGGPIPIPPWRVDIRRAPGGWVFALLRGSEQAVICALATESDATEIWQKIERHYFELTEQMPGMLDVGAAAPEMPTQAPWLAVLILPGMLMSTCEDVGWMGDFERCLAWTLLESGNNTPRAKN